MIQHAHACAFIIALQSLRHPYNVRANNQKLLGVREIKADVRWRIAAFQRAWNARLVMLVGDF
jgi:hypothetical protein